VSGEREFFAQMVVDAVTALDASTLDLKMIGMKKVRHRAGAASLHSAGNTLCELLAAFISHATQAPLCGTWLLMTVCVDEVLCHSLLLCCVLCPAALCCAGDWWWSA
jgi:hypothetical protein